MLKTSEDNRYAFVVGRVRAREAFLFDRSRYEQLIAAEDDELFLRNLANSPYAEFQKSSVDEILNDAWNENFGFLRKYCLDEPVLNLFMYREDLHNIKLLLKAKITKTIEQEHCLSQFGTIPISTLTDMVQTILEKERLELRHIPMPEFLKKGITQALLTFEATKDPTLLDSDIDRTAMGYFVSLVQMSEFLTTFYKHRIDLENIRTFLRIRIFKEKEDLFSQAFIPGGSIRFSWFEELITDLLEMVTERFALTPFRTVVAEGIHYLLNNKSFLRFERLASEYLLFYLRRARLLTFGFEPLVGYFLIKENEIRNLRKIYQGVRIRADKEQIRESIVYA